MKYITIITAILLVLCSSYFSVIGMMEIFSGNKINAGIAVAALELGKIVIALLLHKHWKESGIKVIKFPLLVCTLVMMVVTSAGIFGVFAKGSQAALANTFQNNNQITLVDTRLERVQNNKERVQIQLKDLDSLVSMYTQRDNMTALNRGVRVRSQQQVERNKLLAELEKLEELENSLIEQKFQLQSASKNIEIEVGPAMYIADVLYGERTEETVEKALKIMILMLVFIFDPMAILLIIAAQAVYQKKESPPQQPVTPTRRQKIKKVKKEKVAPKEEQQPIQTKEIVPETLDQIINEEIEIPVHRLDEERTYNDRQTGARIRKRVV